MVANATAPKTTANLEIPLDNPPRGCIIETQRTHGLGLAIKMADN